MLLWLLLFWLDLLLTFFALIAIWCMFSLIIFVKLTAQVLILFPQVLDLSHLLVCWQLWVLDTLMDLLKIGVHEGDRVNWSLTQQLGDQVYGDCTVLL